MRAGLATSTVTPGSTAPVASLTTPAIALCANAAPGANTSHARAMNIKLAVRFMRPPPDYLSLRSLFLPVTPTLRVGLDERPMVIAQTMMATHVRVKVKRRQETGKDRSWQGISKNLAS